jgi:hypothetical protein
MLLWQGSKLLLLCKSSHKKPLLLENLSLYQFFVRLHHELGGSRLLSNSSMVIYVVGSRTPIRASYAIHVNIDFQVLLISHLLCELIAVPSLPASQLLTTPMPCHLPIILWGGVLRYRSFIVWWVLKPFDILGVLYLTRVSRLPSLAFFLTIVWSTPRWAPIDIDWPSSLVLPPNEPICSNVSRVFGRVWPADHRFQIANNELLILVWFRFCQPILEVLRRRLLKVLKAWVLSARMCLLRCFWLCSPLCLLSGLRVFLN